MNLIIGDHMETEDFYSSIGLWVDNDFEYALKLKYAKFLESDPDQEERLRREFRRELVKRAYLELIENSPYHDESLGTGLFRGKGYQSAAEYAECEMYIPMFSRAKRLCERSLEYYPDSPEYYLYGLSVMIRESHGKYKDTYHKHWGRYPHDLDRLNKTKQIYEMGKDLEMNEKQRRSWSDSGERIESRIEQYHKEEKLPSPRW